MADTTSPTAGAGRTVRTQLAVAGSRTPRLISSSPMDRRGVVSRVTARWAIVVPLTAKVVQPVDSGATGPVTAAPAPTSTARTATRIAGAAMRELYNPAQVDVVRRVQEVLQAGTETDVPSRERPPSKG